jgi:hypothetical protein
MVWIGAIVAPTVAATVAPTIARILSVGNDNQYRFLNSVDAKMCLLRKL